MMDITSDSQCYLQYVLLVNTNYVPTKLGVPEQLFCFTVARAIDASYGSLKLRVNESTAKNWPSLQVPPF